MKKVIMILIAVMILVSVTALAAAADLEIERELVVEGAGSCDFDLRVQTEKGNEGLKLEDTLYTRYRGTFEDSNISYNSNLGVFVTNLTGEDGAAEISYAQKAQTTNTKQLLCSEDYTLGAYVGFYSKGDATNYFELFTDPNLSEFEMEGSMQGRLKFMQKVVDPINRTLYMQEIAQLDGKYQYTWNTFVEGSGYPESGCEEWLSCP